MPSGLVNTSGKNFEIYYMQPWGGTADYANPVDIQPNELVVAQGVVAVDGELSAVVLQADNDPNFVFITPHVANAVVILMWSMNGTMYCLDNFGNIYDNAIPGGGFLYVCSASDGPWAGINGFNAVGAVKVINGVAYVTISPRTSVYSFTPTPSPVFALGSNFVGGLIFGVLDDYLVMLNCDQSVDGVSPSMISWSGPGEFTTWNPASNQLAGFNVLATIDDQLTGFLSFASVGVAISGKSLIELSPTGVGIGPFSFTTLWTSVVGQGSIYPLSVTQYGQQGYLVTDSGVYSVSAGAGFSDISQKAKASILGSFQSPSFDSFNSITPYIAGNVLLSFYNLNYPTPYYVFNAPSTAAPGLYVVWFYDLTTGCWYSTTFDPAVLCNQQHSTAIPPRSLGPGTVSAAQTYTLQPLTPLGATFGAPFTPVTLVQFNVLFGGASFTVIAQFLLFNSRSVGQFSSDVTLNLTFRMEEIKLGRKPTI